MSSLQHVFWACRPWSRENGKASRDQHWWEWLEKRRGPPWDTQTSQQSPYWKGSLKAKLLAVAPISQKLKHWDCWRVSAWIESIKVGSSGHNPSVGVSYDEAHQGWRLLETENVCCFLPRFFHIRLKQRKFAASFPSLCCKRLESK